MQPDAHLHLHLHHRRSAELRGHAAKFHLAATERHTPAHIGPRSGLRTRLGWFLVESGLRILPRHPGLRGRASALPGTA